MTDANPNSGGKELTDQEKLEHDAMGMQAAYESPQPEPPQGEQRHSGWVVLRMEIDGKEYRQQYQGAISKETLEYEVGKMVNEVAEALAHPNTTGEEDDK